MLQTEMQEYDHLETLLYNTWIIKHWDF